LLRIAYYPRPTRAICKGSGRSPKREAMTI
jgi:hypothetical protein